MIHINNLRELPIVHGLRHWTTYAARTAVDVEPSGTEAA